MLSIEQGDLGLVQWLVTIGLDPHRVTPVRALGEYCRYISVAANLRTICNI